jgi:hypothetical protein
MEILRLNLRPIQSPNQKGTKNTKKKFGPSKQQTSHWLTLLFSAVGVLGLF